ncbi:Hypothetical protein ORPV_510 [Orpheovirus IHUMI-LCC2]|uniref:Uncharacterized protein n=1 Tax=Orpheovirus IHUMI-LCC2 TaxID=2023057 RepID=A0A2I2L4G1_9VIRU|nr:Hypothetical protein ORPV_510 [Orpheovirus IHUMI-LCC2]SNW62414.1 Hypothetical protein ORPV_510 [Orpheovirus IHUMI-LCC2]
MYNDIMDLYDRIKELEEQLASLRMESTKKDNKKNICTSISSRYDGTYLLNMEKFTSEKTRVTIIQYCHEDTLVELDDDEHGRFEVSWKVFEYLYTLQSSGHINMNLANKVIEEVFEFDSWLSKVILKLYMIRYNELKSYVSGRIMYNENKYPSDIVNKIVSDMLPKHDISDLIIYV